jgi:hypothetical protein
MTIEQAAVVCRVPDMPVDIDDGVGTWDKYKGRAGFDIISGFEYRLTPGADLDGQQAGIANCMGVPVEVFLFGSWEEARVVDSTYDRFRVPYLKKKCSYADEYKATKPPKCGCETCDEKWTDEVVRRVQANDKA